MSNDVSKKKLKKNVLQSPNFKFKTLEIKDKTVENYFNR